MSGFRGGIYTWCAHDGVVGELDSLILKVFSDKDTSIHEYTELIGQLFKGVLLFAKESYDPRTKRKQDVTTVMAFAFALAGFIPIAGQFAGIVGLVFGEVLQRSWTPQDQRL